MNKPLYFCAFIFTAFLFSCGGLEKEIDLELPAYESQVVVECYLQPGLPYALALTKSAAYFDPFPTDSFDFLESILEDSAEVTIMHEGETIKLENQLYFDQEAQRLYNYFSPDIVPEDFENNFTLSIVTKDGREVRAFTRILPVVPIDSVVVEFNPEVDTLARVLAYVYEDPTEDDYYRRMLHVGSLDTVPDLDFTLNDDFVDDDILVFGTGFDFMVGDTIINSIFHIDRAYFDFLESITFAIDANGNPFGQPAAINSNLEGDAIGIFTGLSYDRVETIIEK
ncbi:MAG TPA: DUF4249 domain-containing protein [Bacteroidetes bacterium]|nr:DUF4249 domain-containing protein [Bacteroidota bacterium]